MIKEYPKADKTCYRLQQAFRACFTAATGMQTKE
jgi:hypothetical protein